MFVFIMASENLERIINASENKRNSRSAPQYVALVPNDELLLAKIIKFVQKLLDN